MRISNMTINFQFFYYFHRASWPYSSRNEILYYRDYATAPLNTIFTSEQLEVVQELKAKKLKYCRLENTGGNDSV